MSLAQNDDVIEALAADGADDPFGERVLPGRAGAMMTSRIPMLARRG